MSLISNLNRAHKSLNDAFKTSAQDAKLAQRLEKFLNYVVYNKGIIDNGSPDSFFTKELADKIRNQPEIVQLFGKAGGLEGEQAFATMMLAIIQQSVPSVDIKNMVDKVIIGDQMATVASQAMLQNASNEIQANLAKGKSIREYTAWNARQGKIDVDMSEIHIEGDFKPEVYELLKITASVKNYTDFNIHLERVNVEKAYMAIMSEAYPKKKSAKELQQMYQDYYEAKTKAADAEVSTHISHLVNAYALTGYGQAYYSKGDAAAIEKKYAKFLMVNNRAAQQIAIRSTGDIIKNEIFTAQNTIGAGFGQRITSSSTKYRDVIEVKYQVK